ncbi:DUF1223 domain-containing protein [Henriciella sp. AS95]|uniref:DUF1223 domain-containing protein n=1 Tax=Henriciella sp. AS95 TaxID=3135782 RepID=UPI00316CB1D7
MIKWLVILSAMLLAPSAPAMAERPVLVELFASQNCTACPKAHRTLRDVEAGHVDDVLILTWSVDYWDYVGQPDPMAMPFASERQKAYTERFGLRAPYTPQSVYDGEKQCPATRKQTVEANIDDQSHKRASGVSIEPVRGGFSVDGVLREPVEVRLVSYLSGDANTTDMVNPVTRSELLGTWTGGRVTYGYTCDGSCAVIVQARGHGEVLAASSLQ